MARLSNSSLAAAPTELLTSKVDGYAPGGKVNWFKVLADLVTFVPTAVELIRRLRNKTPDKKLDEIQTYISRWRSGIMLGDTALELIEDALRE